MGLIEEAKEALAYAKLKEAEREASEKASLYERARLVTQAAVTERLGEWHKPKIASINVTETNEEGWFTTEFSIDSVMFRYREIDTELDTRRTLVVLVSCPKCGNLAATKGDILGLTSLGRVLESEGPLEWHRYDETPAHLCDGVTQGWANTNPRPRLSLDLDSPEVKLLEAIKAIIAEET